MLSTATSLETPPFKSLRYTFPAGTTLDPGAANGLTACAATGAHGINFPNGQGRPGTPGEETGEGEVVAPDGLPRPTQGNCPATSQVGTVTATSPDLREALTGHIYL